jgi:hypothetical protein
MHQVTVSRLVSTNTVDPSLQVVVRVVMSPVVSRLGNVGNFDLPDRVRDFRTTPSYVFWEITKNLRGLRFILIAQDTRSGCSQILDLYQIPNFQNSRAQESLWFPWPAEGIHMGAKISTTIFANRSDNILPPGPGGYGDIGIWDRSFTYT